VIHKISPSRKPAGNIIHVLNLVRPFTINMLKELMGKHGKLAEIENNFWIDKIKSHCFAVVSAHAFHY